MNKIIISLMLIFTVVAATAQSSYVEKIESIAARSLAIEAYRAQFSADSLSFRLGLNPSDPEVSIDYFMDNSFELNVEQRFDFPTVYSNRNKLSKLGIERAGVAFRLTHWELMSQISEQYITLAYYNRLCEILQNRAKNLKAYVLHMEQLLNNGEITKVEFISAQTLSSQMQSELTLALSQQKQCRTTLAQWGYRAESEPKYPDFSPINRESFIEQAFSANLEVAAERVDSMIAHRTLKLSRSEWIPKLKVGYRMEMEGGVSRSAVAAGISIPLWQNRGNVRHSKAMVESSKKSAAATQMRVMTMIDNLFTKYESLENATKEYSDNTREYINMLKKSLEGGMVNRTDFLLSVIERYSVEQRKLELEMQQMQTRATMELLMRN